MTGSLSLFSLVFLQCQQFQVGILSREQCQCMFSQLIYIQHLVCMVVSLVPRLSLERGVGRAWEQGYMIVASQY